MSNQVTSPRAYAIIARKNSKFIITSFNLSQLFMVFIAHTQYTYIVCTVYSFLIIVNMIFVIEFVYNIIHNYCVSE